MPIRIVLAALGAAYLASTMLLLGLDLGSVPTPPRSEKRRARRALLRGLGLQLIVIPAAAGAIMHAVHASSDVSIALMCLVAAPGGGLAPFLVRFGGGETSLAVELSLFLAKLTVFTAPFTAKWLLGLEAVHIRELPFLLQLLLCQFAPLYLGKWIRRRHGALADTMWRPVKWAVAVTALASVSAILLDGRGRNLPGLVGDPGWIGVLGVALVSILLGLLFAGPHGGTRRCFAIGANGRELALALALAGNAFPDRLVRAAVLAEWGLLVIVSALLAWALRGRQKPAATATGLHAAPRGEPVTSPAGGRS